MRISARKKLSLAVIAGGLLGSATPGNSEPFDGGGRVADYLDQILSANATGARVEISGICASACTMKLGARGVCIHRDAQLWFHAAQNEAGGFNALGTRLLLNEYPRRIRAWALGAGALASKQFVTMRGAQAIAYGVTDCDGTSAHSDISGLPVRARAIAGGV